MIQRFERVSQTVGYGQCVEGNLTDIPAWEYQLGWTIETQCPRTADCANPWHWTFGEPIPANTQKVSPFKWVKERRAEAQEQAQQSSRILGVAQTAANKERDEAILADFELGHSKSAIARKYGVHRNTVHNIVSKHTTKGIQGPATPIESA